jgi:hypothetical protein
MQQEHRRGQRVRKISDPSKYRRHQRKKLLRAAAVLSGWAIVVAIGGVCIWIALGWMIGVFE